jgi:hypothetical protein
MKCKSHPLEEVMVGKKHCEKCEEYFYTRKKNIAANGKCIAHMNEDVIPGKSRCQKCSDYMSSRRIGLLSKGKCSNHHSEDIVPGTTTCKICIDRLINLKYEVMSHYCGGTPHCQCPGCEVTFLGFLSIDHIESNGSTHVNKSGIKIQGNYLHGWLKKNNFPNGFQILCFNCNSSKRDKEKCLLYGQKHY